MHGQARIHEYVAIGRRCTKPDTETR
jgi:hypothetical protein